jgi:hypothetical protein
MATRAKPIACTLSGNDLRERRTWLADLAREGLLDHQRGDLGLHLWYRPDVANRLHETVWQEEACCTFLIFEMHGIM